jgi:pyridoxal phosphate enzyme (YggS family)
MIMGNGTLNTIRENYSIVMDQIQNAAASVVVVSKGHPAEDVIQAVEAGISLFGENYIEEAVNKIGVLSQYPGLEWHMIGHVQSRKARLVCENFSLLHSLDSLKLSRRLNQFAAEMGIHLPIFLECNVSGEETKNGFAAWDETLWPMLYTELEAIVDLKNLRISGLMTMAPFFDDPEMARPFFRRLRGLRDFLSDILPEGNWEHLSMGMSGDFQVAVQEGATILRIGTAILGARYLS